jgi:GntR family transcriptional regulator
MISNFEEKVNISKDFTLNSENRVPYYYQLKQYIIDEIESGKWKPKQMFPYENELCTRFSVSRTVVRQALQELKNDGYIITRRGKGTFVAEPKVNENILQNIVGFHEVWKSLGYKVKNEVLMLEKISAPEKVESALKLKKNKDVIILRRLVELDDIPYSIMTNFIPFDLEPKLLEEDYKNKSLTSIMAKKHGIEWPYGKSAIEIIYANDEEAELLKIKKGTPLFLLEGTSFSEDHKPLVYFRTIFVGDRSRIQVDMVKIKTFGKKDEFLLNSPSSGIMIKDLKK